MAIVIERTITVKNNISSLDNPLYLYVGDGDITCLFTIKEVKKAARFGVINDVNLMTDSASYGEVRIYKPTDELVFTTRAEIIDDKLQAIFSFTNIDQLTESGVHKLQIHLYDESYGDKNRFTIPPIDLQVLLPVGSTTSIINDATVGYAMTRVAEEPVDVFNEDGSYNKTEWYIGDAITSSKLNKIEEALSEINDKVPIDVSQLNNDAGYLTEHQSLDSYATKTYVNSSISLGLIDYATKSDIPSLDGLVSSNTITRIEVVRYLPDFEVDGVLYIVTEEE